ncbi:MAG: hypothetical protein MR357_07365 [Anaeroplasma sp.]|nr:hypothetical protein [Anaeroplasma sp.]
MIDHIVKNNETADEILEMYHLSLDELIEFNPHITDFKNLKSGSILHIPMISREVEQILDKTESFIMDYYPKISEEVLNIKEIESIGSKVIKDELEKEKNVVEERENIIQHKAIAYPGILPPKNGYNGNR